MEMPQGSKCPGAPFFLYRLLVTIQKPLFREVFWHEYAKIPRVARKNPIAEDDFHWIFARNCEGTEQLRLLFSKERCGVVTVSGIRKQSHDGLAFVFRAFCQLDSCIESCAGGNSNKDSLFL